ncbi:hypothetical protein WUBG_18524, partial [Wuchereria bancrofti]
NIGERYQMIRDYAQVRRQWQQLIDNERERRLRCTTPSGVPLAPVFQFPSISMPYFQRF